MYHSIENLTGKRSCKQVPYAHKSFNVLHMPGGLGFKNPRLYKICELQEIINYQDDIIFVRGGFTA